VNIFDDYMPDRSIVFQHNGDRWWTDTHIAVRVRQDIPGVTDLAEGQWIGGSQEDEDGDETWEYERVGSCESLDLWWLDRPAAIGYTGVPALWISGIAGSGEVRVLAQCGDVWVDRILLGVAGHVLGEPIVGLGIKGNYDPVAIWTDSGFSGVVMPVRVDNPIDLIPMTWGTW